MGLESLTGVLPIGKVGNIDFLGFAKWIVYGGIIVGIVYFVLQYIRYNVIVEIIENRGGRRRTFKDRAKRIKEDGITKLKLLKRRQKIKEPEFEYYDIQGRKDLYRIYLDKNSKHYYALKPTFDDKNKTFQLQAVPQDIEFWASVEDRKKVNEYNTGFWDKYGHIAIPLIGFTLVFILGIFMFKEFKQVVGGLSQVASALAQLQPLPKAP